ncbi:MAG TPA: DUF4439 domain-containing protein, partial [Propionibacterium sp.]|nr:DUF4439 domain-containing protein [Propionibacterium sp.]
MISVPRRCFLGLAGAVVLGMTGCQASVPVVRGGPTAPPLDASPTPSPVRPDQDTALGHEITLSAMAGQAHESADALDLGPGQRATVGWLATGHSLHASALEHPNPAHRSTTPPPPVPGGTPRPRPPVSESLTGSTREEALDQLRNRLQRALEDYRRATGETRGSTALVWGSLAAYARSAQTALVRDAARPEPPDIPARELAPWSDAEAEQQALRQIHALIYGYQVAIARLSGEENRAARDALVQRRTQRDRLAATLRERGQAAPAAEPA